MKNTIYLIVLCLMFSSCKEDSSPKNFETLFEISQGKETPTYHQVIQFYQSLADTFPEINIEAIGETDSGEPLHLVWYNANSDFNNTSNAKILINNGIHPGESDGIDATMLLFRNLAQGKITPPQNTTIATIPIYNVGGSLNRNSTTRTNQNGPKEYGFRGNARNFDLNRDFIKSDTKNAKTFAKIFHKVNPDVFIDNHVSNGADYQYTLTHLFTQHNKLGGKLGSYLHETLMPSLEHDLNSKNIPITPYVNVWGTTPESGWSQFMDYPRYSTGYTTLFNTLGMMVETHMLKPYKQRVEQTYELMHSMITLTDTDYKTIKNLRQEQLELYQPTSTYTLDWKIDSTKTTTLNFKGYEGQYIDSKVTTGKRLFYDRQKPYTKAISYYNYMTPKHSVTIPKAYIIPKNWHRVIDFLKINQVQLMPLPKDSTITVETYKIEDFNTTRTPFEGHYTHNNTKASSITENLKFRQGDFIVSTKQPSVRYLLATLEPEAPDSFFNWNYFDTILQQKEHFSPYVFEDKAEQILKHNPKLQQEFNTKLLDSSFAKNPYLQLDWLHKKSEHYEKAHLTYPIYRIN
ncbi:MAG: M14 family metallopeptidase [Flavobacteriaceae bacterium]